ncbi:MAG: EAL domain-containing protein [Sideroxyarcus sp.]|nr:EAL domain-containing protein [Sideroxyarcus sp.]
MFNRRLSLRVRLLLLIGFASLATLGVLAYFAISQRNELLARAAADVHDNAVRIARQQQNLIEYAQQVSNLLTQYQGMGDRPVADDCQKLLAHMLQQEPRLANIVISNAKGDYLCNATRTVRLINNADRDYFQQALIRDGFVTGKAIYSRSNGRWNLPVAKALRNSAGRISSVLVVALDLQWINRELSHVIGKEGARIGLIDQNGIVLARYPDPEGWIGRDASGTQFFRDMTIRGGQGAAESTGFDGVARIYGFAPFAETTEGTIHLWVGVSRETVTGKINRNLVYTLAVSFSLLVVLFFIVWVSSERLMLRPISTIAQVARRLGQGDHNARTGLDYRDGEIGFLAQSIDKMAVALMSKNEILRLNRSLKLLSECNSALVRAEDEQQLLAEICRLAVETGDYLMAWVGFAEYDEARTVRPVAQFGYEEGYLGSIKISWADTELGRGPTGTAIRTGTAVINQNCLTNPKMAPWREAALKRGYQSSAALPLVSNKHVLGALALYSAESDAFSTEEVKLLTELANDLAYGIQTLRARVEHEAAQSQLEFLANHDTLTRLPNRLLLQDRFEQAIAIARRDHSKVAVLFLDLDNFKQVNDTLGHEQGDRLLVGVVERLQRCIREADTISRQGGDEFVILLTDIGDLCTVEAIAQNIIEGFADSFEIGGNILTASFSIGISIYPDDGNDFSSLLKHADTALYQAKDAGRNTYRFFSQQMNIDELEHMHLQGELRNAIRKQEFLLHYQPQIDVNSGRIVGAEALVRWQHPERGLLPPGKFIPLAERSGLIIPLGEWILNEACRQAQVWSQRTSPLTVAVNLSALQFKRGNILETVKSALASSGLPARQLELELTESVLLQDEEAVMRTLSSLKEIGVKLSIDDFGTGYSSLSYLKRLAVDKLKVDQSFVRDMSVDPDDAAIVKAIIQLGHLLQLSVIAEGVESEAQMDILKSYGCDEIQGFLFSRPLPAEEFAILAHKQQ